MSERMRILVVEDDRRLQILLRELLLGASHEPTMAESAGEALDRLDDCDPEVVLVDLGLPDMVGEELIRRILERRPSTTILVLTIVSTEVRILSALRAGASGYLFKEDLISRLIPAIAEIQAGGVPLSKSVGRLLLSNLRGGESTSGNRVQAPALTEREHAVLYGLGDGLSYSEIAQKLGISVNTIRSHVRVIYEKLGACSKTEAVRLALRLGLLSNSAP